jgi:FtsP/CotA-like multicopper oxidase with cupredoxin domain
MNSALPNASLTRRGFLAVGTGTLAAIVLASCAAPPRYITPTGAAVRAGELARGGTGRIMSVDLIASPTQIDLAGTVANTWSYGTVPGSTIRLSAGDTLRAKLRNALPDDTSVHWHGLALRNDMDGVPGATQAPIAAGNDFNYEFVADQPGTYWFHPHVGPQLDRGLYGALIVEDPNEPLTYDDEWVVILDDWLDGVTGTPDEVLKELSGGMGGMMSGSGSHMMMGTRSDLLGGDAGDVAYPYFLINGRPPADPETFTSTPGKRIRLRIINAGADTVFHVALAGRDLAIHGDGSQIRAWCYVDDMVEAVLLSLERPEAVGQSFNVGNTRSTVTIYDLAQRIKRLSGCPGEIVFQPLHYADVEIRMPNVEKARELLGFEARVDLDEGLERTIAWYREKLLTSA